MAYIGQPPLSEYTSAPSKDSFTGDGSTTTFDLASEVASAGENALEVFINNVRQEPGSGKAYTLGNDASGDNKRITFTAAPANGAAIYVINDKTNLTSIAPTGLDLNGVEFILDADADTTLTADTDDRIDWKIAGTDHISFGTSSGDTVIKQMTDAKDILFQQYDGRTILDINDGGYVAIANGATGPGQLRLYEDTDLGSNFTAFQVGTQSADITYTLPTADGTDGYQLATDGSGTLSWAAAGTTFANDGNNRVVTGTGSATLNGEANLTFDGSTLAVTGAATVSTTLGVTGALTGSSTIQGTTITATTAFVPDASDGAALGTTSLEFSDLYLADGAVIGFGDDQDVTLTHVADTGLLLSSTDQLQFGDSGTYIFQSADGVLDLVSDTEIELNATTLDINANVEISGTATTTGVHTFTAVPVFPNNTVETADIQDNAITLAKMAGGTDGNIISYDASGDPVAIATGSDGQVLTSAGAGQPPAFETAVSTLAALTDATVSSSDPATNTNPSAVGHLWLNSTSGESYVCTTATTNSNVWINVGGGSGGVGVFDVDFLVVAGGGGGGGQSSYYGGGGGAGGLRSSVANTGGGGGLETTPSLLPSTNYTVTVGAGGAYQAKGSNSVFDTITSIGGGRGSTTSANATAYTTDLSGGCGGGGGTYDRLTPSPSGTSGQGRGGGIGGDGAGAGGGGGARFLGAPVNYAMAIPITGGQQGGDGGSGVDNSITGSSVIRAGGGGGSGWSTVPSDSGGDGGGGRGYGHQQSSSGDIAGTANTGGGGGANSNGNGGAGGSGVVILKYPDTLTVANSGGGLTFTTSTSVSNFKITTFTAGTGSISWS